MQKQKTLAQSCETSREFQSNTIDQQLLGANDISGVYFFLSCIPFLNDRQASVLSSISLALERQLINEPFAKYWEWRY